MASRSRVKLLKGNGYQTHGTRRLHWLGDEPLPFPCCNAVLVEGSTRCNDNLRTRTGCRDRDCQDLICEGMGSNKIRNRPQMNKNIEGESTMKLLTARGLTRTTLLAISASLLATLIMPREAAASDGDDPTNLTQAIEPPGIEQPELSASDSAADKRAYRLKHSYDAGDFYYYQGERMPMRRSLTELVVEFQEDVCEERKRNVIDSTVLDAELIDGGRVRGRPVSRVELVEPLTAATLDETLAAVRGWPEVKYAFPVFVHPQNGGTAALTDELIVKLRSGVELEAVTTAVGPDTLTPL